MGTTKGHVAYLREQKTYKDTLFEKGFFGVPLFETNHTRRYQGEPMFVSLWQMQEAIIFIGCLKNFKRVLLNIASFPGAGTRSNKLTSGCSHSTKGSNGPGQRTPHDFGNQRKLLSNLVLKFAKHPKSILCPNGFDHLLLVKGAGKETVSQLSTLGF